MDCINCLVRARCNDDFRVHHISHVTIKELYFQFSDFSKYDMCLGFPWSILVVYHWTHVLHLHFHKCLDKHYIFDSFINVYNLMMGKVTSYTCTLLAALAGLFFSSYSIDTFFGDACDISPTHLVLGDLQEIFTDMKDHDD